MKRILRHNALSIVFGLLFLGSLGGQAVTGHIAYNEDQVAHGSHPVSFGRYLTSSDFGQAVMENWQSEYLQFLLFLMLTIWFVQRGSPESKKPGEEGLESDEEQMVGEYAKPTSPRSARAGGWRAALYGNSLLILMGAIFLLTWAAQSITGWSAYNEELTDHHEHTIGWLGYVGNAQFWENTFQNWQSEFLAVGSFVVFAVYLRQRGSPESKPVGAPHDATGVEG